MSYQQIDIGCDGNIYLDELHLEDSDPIQYLNDAVVTFSLYASESDVVAKTNPIAGATNVSMPYVSGSNGKYLGVLLASVTSLLTRETFYWIAITVKDSSGNQRTYTVLKRRARLYAGSSRDDCGCN